MPTQRLSYGQRFEDLHLLRGFGEGTAPGFYIDIGAGHPVVDNVSFAFYLRGWSGIAVEPNPALARMTRAVRPRDIVVQALAGAASGTATYYLIDEFHGLSTMIERHARGAHTEFGKSSTEIPLPVIPLAELCAAHAPASIDFLKIDVEGAEADVLRGADFSRFRPKVVLVEALAPFTLAPAWDAFEPLLTRHGYRYAFFDSLNRYYVVEEEADIARRLADAPADLGGVTMFGTLGGALAEEAHPDRRLALLFARGAMIRAPLLDTALIVDMLTADFTPEQLGRPLGDKDVALAYDRLCGGHPPAAWREGLALAGGETVRSLYIRIAESDWFRTRLGRMSGSYSF